MANASEARHYDPHLTLQEAAVYAGYHWQTLREEILVNRTLAASRLSERGRYRIRLSELNRWMKSRETKLNRASFQ